MERDPAMTALSPLPEATRVGSVSLVIPLDEERLADGWLERCTAARTVRDIRVAASARVPDRLVAALDRRGCRVSRSDAPRGKRLREEARRATGDVLVFLHADTRLPAAWLDLVRAHVCGRRPWGAFRLAFENGTRRLGLIAAGANARSRWFGLPFGDQAPFVTRAAYEAVGGHPPWPFLDDLELSLRLRRLAPPRIVRARVRTSPRRYVERGGLRTVCTNLSILARFAAGASPSALETAYRR